MLVGRAKDVYSALTLDQSANYETAEIKTAILRAYELVPEAYRIKFRGLEKSEDVTFVEFAREKENSFTRWCTSLKN